MSYLSRISPHALDVLCPLHLIVSKTGHIRHVGPTVQKLKPGVDLIGQRFLEVFQLDRPRGINMMSDLTAVAGRKLHLQMRDPACALKGVAMPLPGETDLVINLAFGISILDAVRRFSLTSADFAVTDMAIEMLYLIEAKSSAMEASRKLNLRLQGAKIAAEEQAFTDTLTGLKNRRALDHVLRRLIHSETPLAVMHVDLDYFKAVNDTHGHAAGDAVLLNVAKVLIGAVRADDTVARVGGDEFIILLPECLSRPALTEIGFEIIDGLERPVLHNGQPCQISGSIGTVMWDAQTPTDGQALIDDADVALYAAKNRGRGQQVFYEPTLRSDSNNLEPPKGRVDRRDPSN